MQIRGKGGAARVADLTFANILGFGILIIIGNTSIHDRKIK